MAGVASGWLSAALRRQVEADRPLIFDDLERCGMGLEEMMGVFSTYVEHLGFQVVLIGDEEKLVEKHTGYPKAKEKVVGHTAQVAPMTSEAFDAFADTVSCVSKAYIQAAKPQFLEVFETSGCMSLRVLRHVVLDLDRLHQSLEERHTRHDEAMAEITGLFIACGIEVRLGRLKPADLRNRAGQRMGFEMRRRANKNNDVEKPSLVAADDRYPTIDLENQILDDQVLEAILEHGVFDADMIRASIERSPHFVDPGDIPAWQLVSSFDELPDDVFHEALATMNKQFADREITSSGEMLHIFALRLMMAEEGISETDLDTTRDECLQYIDDLLEGGRLPPRELEWRWWDKFERAHGGYGYWLRPAYQDHFKAIRDRLITAREEALEAHYPDIVAEVLDILQKDGIEFYRRLCHTAGHDSPYALIPFLHSIPPNKFVDAWLASPRPAWRWVKSALEDRLDLHRVQNELAAERGWALEVLRLIGERRDELTGFERLRVKRIVPSKLGKLQQPDEDAAVDAAIDESRNAS